MFCWTQYACNNRQYQVSHNLLTFLARTVSRVIFFSISSIFKNRISNINPTWWCLLNLNTTKCCQFEDIRHNHACPVNLKDKCVHVPVFKYITRWMHCEVRAQCKMHLLAKLWKTFSCLKVYRIWICSGTLLSPLRAVDVSICFYEVRRC